MRHPKFKMSYSPILALAAAAVASCGAENSTAKSEGATEQSGEIWLDAWGPEQLYSGQIQIDAINAGEDPYAADKSCEAMLVMAQESLRDPSSVGADVQLMYKTCADAGLKFQNKARCEADRLQVLCH